MNKPYFIIESQSKEVKNSIFDTRKLTKFGFFFSKSLFCLDKNNLMSSLFLKNFNNLEGLNAYSKNFDKKKNSFSYIIKLKSFFFKRLSTLNLFLFLDFVIINKVKFLIANIFRSNYFLKNTFLALKKNLS